SNPTLKAEICWATKVLTSHYSYKSCENAGAIFQTMFPDSDVAKQFSCGENKVAYLTTFGIGPHFSSTMKAKAKKESGYVLLFDESLNREMKKSQLDIHIRFWNDNQVNSRAGRASTNWELGNALSALKLRVGFVTERGLEEHMKKNSEVEAGVQTELQASKEVNTRKCTTVLRLLVETGRIEEKCCDEIIREFGHFYDHSLMSASDSFRDFNPQNEKKTQKRKGMMEDITQMKAKKKRMEEDIRVLMKSADNNAEKAESQGKLSFISKSNGLRRAAKEKERHLETLERQLTDKLKELRDTP
ncbi:hypothetical protein F7725_009263, partial [Dissostichus mawsoni]